MNLTSVLAERDQASRHETGYIIDRLNSFNLSSGVHQLDSLETWEDTAKKSTQSFHTSHFASRVWKSPTSNNQEQNVEEGKKMPRPKRRATSNANNVAGPGATPLASEDMPRHPPKRARNTNSSRRYNTKSEDSSSFSQKRCISWFREYTTADEPDQLGPEGMEKFCEDIGVEPENVVMLVLAYKMNAHQMGFFTLDEWLRGLVDLQCDTIPKLQAKMDHLRCLLNEPNIFKAIYRYAFDFARQDKDQRSMDMETARAMLQLLLGKHWSLFSQFAKFLDQSKYKVINKDQWCNILEFSRTIYDDLSNYDLDGAWPVMLDEFVEWLKAQQQGGHSQMDTRSS